MIRTLPNQGGRLFPHVTKPTQVLQCPSLQFHDLECLSQSGHCWWIQANCQWETFTQGQEGPKRPPLSFWVLHQAILSPASHIKAFNSFYSFFLSSQTGSWSHMISDSLGRQRKGDLGYKTSIDQARQKHNCVKLQENKQFCHHISRAAPLRDILTSY